MKIPTPRRDGQPRIADDLSGYYNQSEDFNLSLKNPTHTDNDTSELSDSQNATIFIIVSLKIALEMKHNQVGILLSNNHKYFI